MIHLNRPDQEAINDYLEVVPETDYKIFDVDRNVQINNFVEKATGSPYQRGSGFYQLQKKEIVQASKMIYVQDMATKKVYRGEHARALLGLPEDKCQVYPMYSNKYDIYIQSTSMNRKLISGSKLLVLGCA